MARREPRPPQSPVRLRIRVTGGRDSSWHLYRFFLASGSRVALRTWAPLIGGGTLLLGLQTDPGPTVAAFAASLFGPRWSAPAWIGAALALVAGARWTSGRVMHGSRGWIRHLPISRRARLAALWLALTTSLFPMLATLLALAAIEQMRAGGWAWAGAPVVLALGAAAAGIALLGRAAGERPVPRPTGSAGSGEAAAHPAGERGLGRRVPERALPGSRTAAPLPREPQASDTLDALPVPLPTGGGPAAVPPRDPSSGRLLEGRLPFELRIALRAAGGRIVPAWLLSSLPLFAALLFVRNNELPSWVDRRAVVLGAVLALTIAAAAISEGLAILRPAWPWARSLPAGSNRRVRADALFVAVAVLAPAALAALIDPAAALIAASTIPLIASASAAAMRGAKSERRTSAAGPVLIVGLIVGAWLAIVPAVAAPSALLVAPLVYRAAAARDRELRVSRWDERRHLSSGDSLSWTE